MQNFTVYGYVLGLKRYLKRQLVLVRGEKKFCLTKMQQNMYIKISNLHVSKVIFKVIAQVYLFIDIAKSVGILLSKV